jgi:hypothetical protein
MMKKGPLLLIFVLFTFGYANAQPAVQLSYRYLFSRDWDQIIQTYNSSRPWNSAKLQPITHAAGASLCWNLPVISARTEGLNKRVLHLNCKAGYHRFGVSTENYGNEFTVGFHQFDLSVDLRTHPKCLFKPVQNTGRLGTRFYIGIGAGYNAFIPFVKNDGVLISDGEGEKFRERSYAFSGQFLTGYHMLMLGNAAVSAEAGVNWFGNAELIHFAESVNGHNLTGMKNEATSVLMIQFSLRFTWIKATKNWWDNPRSGDKT